MLYPKDAFPLCHKPKADMYHILCKCKTIQKHRSFMIKKCATDILIDLCKGKKYVEQPNTHNKLCAWLSNSCLPEREHYYNGLIHEDEMKKFSDIFQFAQTESNPTPAITIHTHIYRTIFIPIYREYNNSLYSSHNSYSQRLRICYSMTLRQKREADYLVRKSTQKKSKKQKQTKHQGHDIRTYFDSKF